MALPKSNTPKRCNRIANSVDPDQTAPLGAVTSGSALFAQTYLSENLGSLQYMPTEIFNCKIDLYHVLL